MGIMNNMEFYCDINTIHYERSLDFFYCNGVALSSSTFELMFTIKLTSSVGVQ